MLYLYSVEIQTIIAMITENKVIEIFCMADDFCKFFDTMMTKYTLPSTTKRKYMRHLFPKVVSYNRFVELEKEIAIPLALFIKRYF